MSDGELKKRIKSHIVLSNPDAKFSDEEEQLNNKACCACEQDTLTEVCYEIDAAKKELELHSTDIPKTFFPNLKHYVLIDRDTWVKWFGDSK